MAIASALKRQRQATRRTLRNRAQRSAVRTSMKAFESAVSAGDKSLAEERFQYMVKKLDTATRKGLFHGNTAARKKSRLAKRLNQMK